MLDDSAASDSVTRVLADEESTPGSDGLRAEPQPLLRPSASPIRLSRYLLLEPLGQGAFGAVYAAYDPELNRRVAIKLLMPRRDEAETVENGRERLLREAQAMAHFSHPNVVAVYDVGTYSLDPAIGEEMPGVVRAGVFVVMELVEGQRFDHWARERPRSWRELVAPAVEAARGLAAAHAAGLIHRDFKPANVLVDQRDRPRILDFGLARLHRAPSQLSDSYGSLDERSRDSTHDSSDRSGMLGETLTRTGTVLGTPRYMAVEQHRGEDASALSDQFAFCVTLYELLYRVPPFRSRRLEGLLQAKLRAPELRPPSGDVPLWLFRVLRRGLDPEPEQRFIDMLALIAALERDPSRRRRQVVLGAAVAAATVSASVVAGRLSHEGPSCGEYGSELDGVWDPAVAQRVEAAFEATGLPHASQSMQTVSASLDDWARAWVSQRVALCEASQQASGPSAEEQAEQRLCLERHRRRAGGLTRVLGEADAQVVAAAGLMASELGLPDRCASAPAPDAVVERGDGNGSGGIAAEETVAEARGLMVAQKNAAAVEAAQRAITQAEATSSDHLRARAHLVLASSLLGGDEGQRSLDEAALAIEWAEQAGDDELACEALVVLFRAQARVGRYDGADMVARLAVARAEANMVGDRVAATLAYELGALRTRQGRYAEAYAHLQQARVYYGRMHGSEHPLVARVDNAMGLALYRDGRRAEAQEAFERSIASYERSLGPEHPNLAGVYSNYGNYWMVGGRYDEAHERQLRSARILEANYPPDDIAHALAQHNLGLIAVARGHGADALRHFERAERLRVPVLGDDHPAVLNLRAALARTLIDMGRYPEGVAQLRDVLRRKRAVLGDSHRSTIATAMKLVRGLAGAGEVDEAVTLAEQTLAQGEKDHAGTGDLGRWMVWVARTYQDADRPDDAERLATRSLSLLRFDSGENSPQLSQAYLTRGDARRSLGEAEGAESDFSRALELLAKIFGDDHGRVAWPLYQRALTRRAMGREADARADLERASRVSKGYEGSPTMRAEVLFEMLRMTPSSAAMEDLRAELRQVREDHSEAGIREELDALEQTLKRWRKTRTGRDVPG